MFSTINASTAKRKTTKSKDSISEVPVIKSETLLTQPEPIEKFLDSSISSKIEKPALITNSSTSKPKKIESKSLPTTSETTATESQGTPQHLSANKTSEPKLEVSNSNNRAYSLIDYSKENDHHVIDHKEIDKDFFII